MTTLNGHTPLDGAWHANGVHTPSEAHGSTTLGAPMAGDEPDLVAQRGDLEQQLAAVRRELADTRARTADRDAAVKAALREELVASRHRLAEMDAAHEATIETIRRETQEQVERIIADAQRRIEELS